MVALAHWVYLLTDPIGMLTPVYDGCYGPPSLCSVSAACSSG